MSSNERTASVQNICMNKQVDTHSFVCFSPPLTSNRLHSHSFNCPLRIYLFILPSLPFPLFLPLPCHPSPLSSSFPSLLSHPSPSPPLPLFLPSFHSLSVPLLGGQLHGCMRLDQTEAGPTPPHSTLLHVQVTECSTATDTHAAGAQDSSQSALIAGPNTTHMDPTQHTNTSSGLRLQCALTRGARVQDSTTAVRSCWQRGQREQLQTQFSPRLSLLQ